MSLPRHSASSASASSSAVHDSGDLLLSIDDHLENPIHLAGDNAHEIRHRKRSPLELFYYDVALMHLFKEQQLGDAAASSASGGESKSGRISGAWSKSGQAEEDASGARINTNKHRSLVLTSLTDPVAAAAAMAASSPGLSSSTAAAAAARTARLGRVEHLLWLAHHQGENVQKLISMVGSQLVLKQQELLDDDAVLAAAREEEAASTRRNLPASAGAAVPLPSSMAAQGEAASAAGADDDGDVEMVASSSQVADEADLEALQTQVQKQLGVLITFKQKQLKRASDTLLNAAKRMKRKIARERMFWKDVSELSRFWHLTRASPHDKHHASQHLDTFLSDEREASGGAAGASRTKPIPTNLNVVYTLDELTSEPHGGRPREAAPTAGVVIHQRIASRRGSVQVDDAQKDGGDSGMDKPDGGAGASSDAAGGGASSSATGASSDAVTKTTVFKTSVGHGKSSALRKQRGRALLYLRKNGIFVPSLQHLSKPGDVGAFAVASPQSAAFRLTDSLLRRAQRTLLAYHVYELLLRDVRLAAHDLLPDMAGRACYTATPSGDATDMQAVVVEQPCSPPIELQFDPERYTLRIMSPPELRQSAAALGNALESLVLHLYQNKRAYPFRERRHPHRTSSVRRPEDASQRNDSNWWLFEEDGSVSGGIVVGEEEDRVHLLPVAVRWIYHRWLRESTFTVLRRVAAESLDHTVKVMPFGFDGGPLAGRKGRFDGRPQAGVAASLRHVALSGFNVLRRGKLVARVVVQNDDGYLKVTRPQPGRVGRKHAVAMVESPMRLPQLGAVIKQLLQ